MTIPTQDAPITLPIEMLHDGSQYTPMVVLVCVGLKALGLSSNCIRDAVANPALGLNILLPTYKDKKGNTQPYWPSASTIDSYDGVAEGCATSTLS